MEEVFWRGQKDRTRARSLQSRSCLVSFFDPLSLLSLFFFSSFLFTTLNSFLLLSPSSSFLFPSLPSPDLLPTSNLPLLPERDLQAVQTQMPSLPAFHRPEQSKSEQKPRRRHRAREEKGGRRRLGHRCRDRRAPASGLLAGNVAGGCGRKAPRSPVASVAASAESGRCPGETSELFVVEPLRRRRRRHLDLDFFFFPLSPHRRGALLHALALCGALLRVTNHSVSSAIDSRSRSRERGRDKQVRSGMRKKFELAAAAAAAVVGVEFSSVFNFLCFFTQIAARTLTQIAARTP